MKRREFGKMAAAGLVGLGFSPAVKAGSSIFRVQTRNNDIPVNIGSRLEMFVDDLLVDKMDNVEFRMHHPQKLPLPGSPLTGAYVTVIKDGFRYRAYYRDIIPGYDGHRRDGHPGEITCYAESLDGHEWTFPNLSIIDKASRHGNNVILYEQPFCHNFSPFLDLNPGPDNKHRFKALAGSRDQVHERSTGETGRGGLYPFSSDDGVHWKKMQDKPVITEGAFDSQNVVFWSEAEKKYVCYFRSFDTPYGRIRSISRTTSEDFIRWTDPVPMNPNIPVEHLYTSQTHPYFRASHIYIALPTRFVPDRGDSTDILFMSSRAGTTSYSRLFTGAFIRPGLDQDRWGNRSNYVALNVVPTGEKEMSIYHAHSGHRYILRTDGFISVCAGTVDGEIVTKPLIFSGKDLVANYSTSAAGNLRVEIQEPDGRAISGFSLDDCETAIGDTIKGSITWKSGAGLHKLAGRPVRLRFVINECDIYSFRFI